MDRRDAMWLLVFVVLGVGGLAVFLNYYTEAIPSASLDFKLSRDEVHREAQGYLENLGYDLADYQSAQIFSSSQMQQIFLEQTLGLEETSRLARDWLSVWSWSVQVVQAAAEGGTSGGAGSRADELSDSRTASWNRTKAPASRRTTLWSSHRISCGKPRGTTWTPTS